MCAVVGGRGGRCHGGSGSGCAIAGGRGDRRHGGSGGGCGSGCVLRGEVACEHVRIVLSCQICEGRI